MNTNQLRQSFLDYFAKNDHKVMSSASLVPAQDPSLMFTNSGMVQFKNYFTGNEISPNKRVTTSQKCVRAGGKHNDLENVGYTARHHTFFEMLGNFAFEGSYFKAVAIELAWNYLTKELEIDPTKLYITIFHDDEEACNIWHKLTGFSDSKIIKIRTSDNFWSMGDTGPCGPCSEIFFDHGEQYHGGLPGTPNQDGDRYIEIWNLVFMQYEQLSDGSRLALPKPAIDTGMGLERIAAVLQGVNDNYDIDLFKNLINAICQLTGKREITASHKVIADHLRSSCFLLADGVMPSNEGRGYVLRRIMRRAMRHIYNLGYREIMLPALVHALVTEMGDAYPELKRAENAIKSVLQFEEEKFSETLGRGMRLLESSTEHLKMGEILDGETAFKLYDTYGFPLDLTTDILKARGIAVDEAGFESSMQHQKAQARAAWNGSGEQAEEKIWYKIEEEHGVTEFLGYSTTSAQAKVLAIISDGNLVQSVSDGSKAIIIVNQTPFYAESGGQVGDTGTLQGNDVTDTKKYASGVFGHHITITTGLKAGDSVELKIDISRRNKIKAHHSATHLLHHVLRKQLGDHVAQKGSIVTHEKLRLDFSHQKPLSLEEIENIEKEVNSMIIDNASAATDIMPPQLAIEKGAMALFGEKYGDQVRVVAMGQSIELCGGTHVCATGDIGLFKITCEESIAAGVRRIEAVTGLAALEFCNKKQNILRTITSSLKCAEIEVAQRLQALQDDNKLLNKILSDCKAEAIYNTSLTETIANVTLVSKILTGYSIGDLKTALDLIRSKVQDGIIILVSRDETTTTLIGTKGEVAQKIGANILIKAAIESMGGKGGGNAVIAQAGGGDGSKLDETIRIIKEYIIQSC